MMDFPKGTTERNEQAGRELVRIIKTQYESTPIAQTVAQAAADEVFKAVPTGRKPAVSGFDTRQFRATEERMREERIRVQREARLKAADANPPHRERSGPGLAIHSAELVSLAALRGRSV